MSNGSLSEAERNQILNTTIASLMAESGYRGTVNTSTGRVTLRRTGPAVTNRGSTWAEVEYQPPLTQPALIGLYVMFTMFTCGLFLPWWFYRTFKPPKVWTLSIDESGDQGWTQHEISQGQRILRWVLLVPIVAFLAFMALGVILNMAGFDGTTNNSGMGHVLEATAPLG